MGILEFLSSLWDFLSNLLPKLWQVAKHLQGWITSLLPLCSVAWAWFLVRTDMFIDMVDRLINSGFDSLSLPPSVQAPVMDGLSFLNSCVPLDVIGGILVTASILWVTVLTIRSFLSILNKG